MLCGLPQQVTLSAGHDEEFSDRAVEVLRMSRRFEFERELRREKGRGWWVVITAEVCGAQVRRYLTPRYLEIRI
jgi:hypothetical protein